MVANAGSGKTPVELCSSIAAKVSREDFQAERLHVDSELTPAKFHGI